MVYKSKKERKELNFSETNYFVDERKRATNKKVGPFATARENLSSGCVDARFVGDGHADTSFEIKGRNKQCKISC